MRISVWRKTARNSLPLLFQDRGGQIDGKYWDAKEEDIQPAGQVVAVTGKRELYQNNPQLRITKLRLAREGEPSRPELYMERAPLKSEEMVEEVSQILFGDHERG